MTDLEMRLTIDNKWLRDKVNNLEEDLKIASRQLERYQKEMDRYHSMYLEAQTRVYQLEAEHERL